MLTRNGGNRLVWFAEDRPTVGMSGLLMNAPGEELRLRIVEY